MSTKLLTFATIGRNDNYCGNFKYRLAISINLLAKNLKLLGHLDEVEVVVCDWNSGIPLAEELQLLPEAAQICRFVYVSPTIAEKYNNVGQVFHFDFASNVAVRRGKGRYCLLFPADTLFSLHSLKLLIDLLNGKLPIPYIDVEQTYFLCGIDRAIPGEIFDKELPLEFIERYLLLTTAQATTPTMVKSTIGGGMSGLLMHRALWNECRGAEERSGYWGWSDIDLMLRISQKYPVIEGTAIGIAFCSIDNHQHEDYALNTNKKNKPHIISETIAINSEDWGLGGECLPILTVKSNAEDFLHTSKYKDIWGDENTKKIVTTLNNPEFDAWIKHRLARFVENGWPVNIEERMFGAIKLLAAACIQNCPCRYLQIGCGDEDYVSTPLMLVASICKSIEMYLVFPWKNTNDERINANAGTMLYNAFDRIKKIGHVGATNIITGNETTAIERLLQAFIGVPSFDLVFIMGNLFSLQEILIKIKEIFPYVFSGMMIVICGDSSTCKAVARQLAAEYENVKFVSTGNVLLVLK